MVFIVDLATQNGLHYCGVSFLRFMGFLVIVIAGFKLAKYFSLPEDEIEGGECPLKTGNMYLVKGKDVERSYALFADTVDQNTKGLLITRKSPHRVRAIYNITKVTALWLSQKEEENVLYPTQLHKLAYVISETVSTQKDPIILLDGLEYLIVHNRFEQVLKQLYIIREVLSRHGGILLIPLDPEAFSEKELGFLEKESVPI